MRAAFLLTVLLLPSALMAQDRAATLADIRLQLRALNTEITSLKRELEPSGGAAAPASVSGGALERLDGLEAELRKLTARTEELDYRINRVVDDGTTRVGDLNFRLTELEGGNLGQIQPPAPLGGQEGLAVPAPASPGMGSAAPQLAVGESAEFEAAKASLSAGDPGAALEGFDRFLAAYPRSPLAPAAQLARGRALGALGRHAEAGRAYLEAFTQTEASDKGIASAGLLGLGQSLAQLNQTREACLTLGQVEARYPGTAAAGEARTALARQTCS
ncbi:tetratricopeptide repeat protein [Mangrovicoccus algicola]|uniref:Tetratricopeptide repeat protein n=1 Tax=Mangrovicoccus algicola TaxID=2771008 RepID=A0A8J6Z1K3_9RHOB|nr:tetratricopeptide repeat protein [Mangrovicoccus algicola]MBE3639998.1 tetratricopeptide repeat protein [Mangrovicoccus algicola]